MKLIVRLEIHKPFDCHTPGGATCQQCSRVVIRHSMSVCDFVTVCTHKRYTSPSVFSSSSPAVERMAKPYQHSRVAFITCGLHVTRTFSILCYVNFYEIVVEKCTNSQGNVEKRGENEIYNVNSTKFNKYVDKHRKSLFFCYIKIIIHIGILCKK